LYSKFQKLQKKHESPADGIFAREKLPRAVDRELIAMLERLVMLCSLHLKKPYEVWVRGFQWVSLEKG